MVRSIDDLKTKAIWVRREQRTVGSQGFSVFSDIGFRQVDKTREVGGYGPSFYMLVDFHTKRIRIFWMTGSTGSANRIKPDNNRKTLDSNHNYVFLLSTLNCKRKSIGETPTQSHGHGKLACTMGAVMIYFLTRVTTVLKGILHIILANHSLTPILSATRSNTRSHYLSSMTLTQSTSENSIGCGMQIEHVSPRVLQNER